VRTTFINLVVRNLQISRNLLGQALNVVKQNKDFIKVICCTYSKIAAVLFKTSDDGFLIFPELLYAVIPYIVYEFDKTCVKKEEKPFHLNNISEFSLVSAF